MIIKVSLIFILSWFSISIGEPVVWSKDKKLSWNDFQANAPKLDSHVALSRVEIQYESSVDKAGKMTMEIKGVFIKEQSWVKQDRKSESILKHEQYHFNLTEVWARKLRKEITSEKWNVKTFEKEFNSLFKKHMAQTLKEQLRYDNETNHSQVSDKQTAWEGEIDKELVSLKLYSGTNVTFLFE
ncbi:MAG: hypothetical protein WAU36_01385 [Cyclobacteriaceae bacterium]